MSRSASPRPTWPPTRSGTSRSRAVSRRQACMTPAAAPAYRPRLRRPQRVRARRAARAHPRRARRRAHPRRQARPPPSPHARATRDGPHPDGQPEPLNAPGRPAARRPSRHALQESRRPVGLTLRPPGPPAAGVQACRRDTIDSIVLHSSRVSRRFRDRKVGKPQNHTIGTTPMCPNRGCGFHTRVTEVAPCSPGQPQLL